MVKLLAKMFGAKDSELAAQNKPLWQCYLGRWVPELWLWHSKIFEKSKGLEKNINPAVIGGKISVIPVNVVVVVLNI